MQALSILGGLGVLALASLVGALMAVMGSRRVFKLVGNPHLSWEHVRERGAQVALPFNTILVLAGLFLLAASVRGLYRVIWMG